MHYEPIFSDGQKQAGKNCTREAYWIPGIILIPDSYLPKVPASRAPGSEKKSPIDDRIPDNYRVINLKKPKPFI